MIFDESVKYKIVLRNNGMVNNKNILS